MAKPRVFVSSTYYDLKHIRSSLEAFISSLGYESILFENGDIPFHHNQPLDVSCYESVDTAHIFVLIIGGRYGSSSSLNSREGNGKDDNEDEKKFEFYNSITVDEYKRARRQDIPIYIFLEKGVAAEYLTYKANRELKTIKYAHVDNANIFRLLDDIYAESRNNLVHEFEKFENITFWLKSQWAGLFADHLSKRKSDAAITALVDQVQSLNQVVDALKTYSEEIVKRVETDPKVSGKIIDDVEDKLIQDILKNNHLIDFLASIKEDFISDKNLREDVVIKAIDNPNYSNFINSLNFNEEDRDMALEMENYGQRDLNKLRISLYEINSLKPKFSQMPKDSIHIKNLKEIDRIRINQRNEKSSKIGVIE